MFKSKRPHTIHLSRVPQKLSYGIFHDREPACSSIKSQQWGSSDPLKYNNAKHTVFLLVQTNMERHLSYQLPEVFRTWFWSNELEGKSHLYTCLFTHHNCYSQLLRAGYGHPQEQPRCSKWRFLWRISSEPIKALTAS